MSNLTKTFVRTATCKAGKAKQEFYDDTLKGFMLEVRNLLTRGQTPFLNFSESHLNHSSSAIFPFPQPNPRTDSFRSF